MSLPVIGTRRNRLHATTETRLSSGGEDGTNTKEEDEIEQIPALGRWRRGKIARRAISKPSLIAKHTRAKRLEPVLQAPLRQIVGNQGSVYVKVPYSLLELEQWKTTVGKYKENPDKVAVLVEQVINSQNPDWADLNSMLDTLLDPTERRMVNKAIVEASIANGLLQVQCECKFNTPILAVKKADGKSYRLVQDLRAINKITRDIHPVVANPYTLLTTLTDELGWLTVVDLKDYFFFIPMHKDSQELFAFEWENPETGRKTQLTWTVLPQGFHNSPTIFGNQLAKELEDWKRQEPEGAVLQYVDDILIAEMIAYDLLSKVVTCSSGQTLIASEKMKPSERKNDLITIVINEKTKFDKSKFGILLRDKITVSDSHN
ncbi:hypothetical protein DUI87_13419 [Hirundo rustica rustica]|uniref:ribonuclease H n=1 Tax=Hirundo rustica rustica TaxID=333673 RepID=A0A3M0K8V8_HIRRU|nr:hypothetical protein DUI87_13419 [Hirundo rustica rustica]